MSGILQYEEDLARRAQLASEGGFIPDSLPEHLFPFQRALVEWSLSTDELFDEWDDPASGDAG